MRDTGRFSSAFGAALVLGALLACGEGGANSNQKGVGDQPGGVQLGIGDIAVAPFGNYVLFQRDQGLAVGWIDNGSIRDLPVEAPTRLAFSKKRTTIYVGSDTTDEIFAVDVGQEQLLWHVAVTETATEHMRIAVSQDDRFVVVASPYRVEALDAATGAPVGSRDFANGVVDMKVLPDSKRVLVVEQHQWAGDSPSTRLTLWNLESQGFVTVNVPNCADDIAVSADGHRALLAPTTCSKDPVSVIDLSEGAEKWERNLPGFGPVALAPDGTTAVAFFDRDNVDLSLFDDPSKAPGTGAARYHLMLLDTATLEYEFAEVGEQLPRYAVTPDGNVLLVDSSFLGDQSTRLFDVTSRTFRDIDGPEFTLGNFALSSDSQHAYAIESVLYAVDISGASSETVGLAFTPTNLNISADDRLLFLRQSEGEICIFDLETRACQRRFVAAAP